MKAGSRIICILSVGVLPTCFLCGTSEGQNINPQPDYSYVYASGESSYNVAPGGSVEVPLYLLETSGDSTSLLSSEKGLEEAGVQANVSNSPSDPAFVTGVAANLAFDEVHNTTPGSFPSTGGSIFEFCNPSDSNGVLATVFPATGVSAVYLGMLDITAGNTPGQATQFTVAPLTLGNDGGPIGNTFTFVNNFDLDANNDPYFGGGSLYNSAAASTFTVTTTGPTDPAPLPAALAMGLAAMGLFFVSRRKGWLTAA